MLGRVIQTLIFCGFTPRRCALKSRTLRLRIAYLGHLLAIILAVAAYLAIIIALDPRGEIAAELTSLSGWSQPEDILALFALFAILEIAFLLLALLLLPWTDPRTDVRTASKQALRTVWLHTGHLALAAFPCIALIAWVAYTSFYWSPKLVNTFLLPAAFGLGVIWILWGIFRTATVPLEVIESREPLCEQCGYNLSYHQDPNARCPECAQPAQWSLSPDRRQPLRWRTHQTPGQRLRWLHLTFNAWLQPQQVFTNLTTQTSPAAAGLFLAVQLFLTGEAFALALTLSFIGITRNIPIKDLPDFFYTASLVGGLMCLWIGAFICLVAAILGLIVSRQTGRNCFGGVIHTACYCSGIFPPWAFLQTVGMNAAAAIMIFLGVRWQVVYAATSLGSAGLIVFLIVLYIGAVARRTAHTRYANR